MRSRACAAAVIVILAATSAAEAQPRDPSSFLGGLLSGDQRGDGAVREAFERGYHRGREDQARADRDRGPPPGRYPDHDGYDDRPLPPPGPYSR